MNIQKLIPVCKDYLWGGNKLKEKYGKQTSCSPCAESWELSCHSDGKTLLENGKTLEEILTKETLGTNVQDFPFFPLLIKLIDAKSNLSVQVHPSDDYALAHENSFGKTEMWYIIEADKGAGIYLGFSRDVTKEKFERAIKENTLTELLNFYPVKAGDCYFIPSGTIHAIGAGCLIAEIQQNSNLTYRVYDYGRRDKNGNERELHIDKAMRVTNLKKHERNNLTGDTLGISKYFSAHKLSIDGRKTLNTNQKSFHCITCVKGSGKINEQEIKQGDSFFIPAGFGDYTLEGVMTAIMTSVRKYYLRITRSETFIKGEIVDDEGTVVLCDKLLVECEKGADGAIENLVSLCKSLMNKANISPSDLVSVDIDTSGTIDCSNHLGWMDPSLADRVSKSLSLPQKIC